MATLLREDDAADRIHLARLRAEPNVVTIDRTDTIRRELTALRPAPNDEMLGEPRQWAWYPWRQTLISVPGPLCYRRLRLDRNRNKITTDEQDRFGLLNIGIVGLSVGHSIAHTLALEGLCGRLRLADNDTIELSNLNRIPATVFDLGINKAIVVARRIAELDPHLPTDVFTSGLTEECMEDFFDGLDLVVEECDSLDMKVRVREEARARGIPVFMETSDRGLFDVERFDSEPERALFHGLLGEVDPTSLHGLSTHDKAPHVMRILQTADLSPRMAASMVEIDRTVSTWPQLGGDVQLGGATVAAAVRRFGRGEALPSGRVRIDLDHALDGLGGGLSDAPGSAGRADGRRPDRARPGHPPGRHRARHCAGPLRRQQSALGGRRDGGRDRHPAGAGAILGDGRRFPRQLCRHRRRCVQRQGGRHPALDARIDHRISARCRIGRGGLHRPRRRAAIRHSPTCTRR